VNQFPDSESIRADDDLGERVDAIAAWLNEIDARVGAAEVATGGEKAAKELRKAIEALAKHDPKLEDRLTNRVDVVTERLATMATTISTTAAALAKKDGEIATLHRELEEGNAKIQALAGELRSTSRAADVEELRRTVAALSAEPPRRKSDSETDGPTGKVDVLGQRLDMLATTVATTAAGLAGREGELAALRRRLDDDNAKVEAAVAELRRLVDPTPVSDLMQSVKAVSDQASAVKRAGQRGLDAVSAKVDSAAGRLDSLSQTVATTAAGLAAKEDEIATLRAAFDQETARTESVLPKVQHAIGALSSQMAKLDELAEREAVDELRADLDRLAVKLDSLGATVEGAAAGEHDKELEIAALSRRFDAGCSRVDALVGELRTALDTMPEPGLDPELENSLDAVAEHVDGLANELARLGEATSTRWNDASAVGAALELQLSQVADRLAALEQDRAETTAEVARASESWAEERAWVRERLEVLHSPPAHEDRGPVLEELAARLDAMEQERVAVASDIARMSVVFETERASLQEQLNGLRAATSEPPSQAGNDHSDRLLREVAERLDRLEQDGASVASELSRAGAFWSSALGSIEARLDEVVSSAGDEAPGLPTVASGGRFRLEIRALELRLEHAEAAARENREAVLLQLERLASRIEWRLHRLETVETVETVETAGPPYSEPQAATAGAQVVHIRGNDV
jgi:chromosome segregation ATPase